MKRVSAILFILLLPVLSAGQMEILLIENNILKPGTRPAVVFPHGTHMMQEGIECTRCHHRFDKGVNVLDASELEHDNAKIYCASCHSSGAELQRSYHRLCIRCHEMYTIKKLRSGPRLCGECHRSKVE